MTDAKAEFTDAIRRLIRVSKDELSEEERKHHAERHETDERKDRKAG